jgi:hypothetical protein
VKLTEVARWRLSRKLGFYRVGVGNSIPLSTSCWLNQPRLRRKGSRHL